MSMIGNFRGVSDDDTEALLERPSRVVRLLYDEDPPERRSLLGGLFGGGRSEPPDDSAAQRRRRARDRQGVAGHPFLADRNGFGSPPLNFILGGGEWLGDVDVGYGAARAFGNDEVRTIATALDGVPPDTLRERFEPKTMMDAGVYPEIWDRDPAEDDTLGYLLHYHDDLRAFVRRRAERGEGMLVYLN